MNETSGALDTPPLGPTRIALLGLGAAARTIHLPACRRLERVQLVAGADPDPAARHALSGLDAGVSLFDDPAELLERERPDWVIVAAPPSAHSDLCHLALESGAHVFCEKPLVERVDEAEALIEASDRTGRALTVNHEFARMPIFEAAREAIGSDEFGELLFLQFWEHLNERPAEIEGWRSAGHTMREFGTHVVDLAVSYCGELPENVFASMPRPFDMGESDLIDVVILEFSGGRVASIVLDRVCRGPHRYLEMRLDGEHGSLRASIGGRASFSLSLAPGRNPGPHLEWAAGGQAWLEVGERRRVLARNPRDAFAHATARMLQLTIDAVSRGEAPPCSARDARSILAVVEAAYLSAQTGRRVSPAEIIGDASG